MRIKVSLLYPHKGIGGASFTLSHTEYKSHGATSLGFPLVRLPVYVSGTPREKPEVRVPSQIPTVQTLRASGSPTHNVIQES